jgi:hypothetical protein
MLDHLGPQLTSAVLVFLAVSGVMYGWWFMTINRWLLRSWAQVLGVAIIGAGVVGAGVQVCEMTRHAPSEPEVTSEYYRSPQGGVVARVVSTEDAGSPGWRKALSERWVYRQDAHRWLLWATNDNIQREIVDEDWQEISEDQAMGLVNN